MSLTACGGGGGGGGEAGGGIVYSGATDQALIDASNAESISTSSFQGGSTGVALGGLGAVQTTETVHQGRPRSLMLVETLEDAFLQLDVSSISGGVTSGAIQSVNGTIPGDCPQNPGDASYTISYDDQTGDFSGSFNFNGYCSEGVAISGSASFSGKIDLNTLNFLNFSISLHTLTVTQGSDSFTTDGDISYDFSTSPKTVTMNNLLIKDNTTSQVFKIENLSMTLVDGSNYVEVNVVSGRFYHPDHGYVDTQTTAPFRIYDRDDWPSQGVLICTGATGGGGGNTVARLTALSSTQYQVEADTDGDGIYDYNSGNLLWDDL